MAKKLSDAFYRAAVLGVEDADGNRIPGLRNVARGFTVADGYNMTQPLTRARKRRVEAYWNKLQELTSQPKILFRSRVPKNLRTVQEVVGQDRRFQFSVAFVHFVPIEGQPRPTITVKGDMVILKTKTSTRRFLRFKPVALATDPVAEVKRIVEAGGKNAMYSILAGDNKVKTMFEDDKLQAKILDLQTKYDGVRPLPKRSRNFGDDPRKHNWRDWMFSVESLQLKRMDGKAKEAVMRRFDRANDALKIRNRRLRKKAYR